MRIGRGHRRKLPKIKWYYIVVAMVGFVVAAFYLDAYVSSEGIIENYRQMSSSTVNRRDGAKSILLKAYVTATGDLTYLRTMGLTETDIRDIASSVTDLGNSGGGDSGEGGNSGGGGGGNGPGGGGGGNSYTKLNDDDLGYIPQSTATFDFFGNANGGPSIKDAGCGILAAYFIYANNGGTKSFEETIYDAFPDRVEYSGGVLKNKPGKGFEMGVLTGDWKHYVNSLGYHYGSRTNGTPSSNGDYVFRYLYGKNGQHNIYLKVSGGGAVKQVACSSGKTWSDTISRPGYNPQYYVKIWK